MNFLGHHEVARRLYGPEPRTILFASMSPDFAGMLGLEKVYKKSNSSPPNSPTKIGLQLHTDTNKAFDSIPIVMCLEETMAEAFKTFMPKWSGLQCAKAGKDMLFDGLLLKNTTATMSYGKTMWLAANGEIDITNIAEPQAAFKNGINRLEKAGIPDYSNPTFVANALFRRISRLRAHFSEDLIPQLAESLEVHQKVVDDCGLSVIEETIDKISSSLA
jgi:hypothetical protein